MGVACAATKYGASTCSASRERPSSAPSGNAAPTPMIRPPTISSIVAAACGSIVPSAQARTNRAATTSGAGSTNVG